MHREPAPGSACAFGWVCRHIKKAFITLCSDWQKSRKFRTKESGLSNDRCPRDVYILYTRTLLFGCTRAYVHIGVGFALSVLFFKAMREPLAVERQQSDSTLFYMSINLTVICIVGSSYATKT